MEIEQRLSRLSAVFSSLACLGAMFLAFPPSAYAVEVGCFCTFVFVSSMFVVGVGVTMVVKYSLSAKMWKLSKTRTVLITFLEVVLMVVVLIVLQTKFYLRVLAYLPLAFMLNYGLAAVREQHPQGGEGRRRLTLAALSSLVLPAAVQLMAWVGMFLSDLITFKEIRV